MAGPHDKDRFEAQQRLQVSPGSASYLCLRQNYHCRRQTRWGAIAAGKLQELITHVKGHKHHQVAVQYLPQLQF